MKGIHPGFGARSYVQKTREGAKIGSVRSGCPTKNLTCSTKVGMSATGNRGNSILNSSLWPVDYVSGFIQVGTRR